MVLSGFINAARLASAASSLPLTDHKILVRASHSPGILVDIDMTRKFFGAGSAGIGVAKQLLSFFTLQGMSEEEAKMRIYVSLSILRS